MLEAQLIGLQFDNVNVFKKLCLVGTTGNPPLTQKSLIRFPLPRFLADVRASGGFSC